MFKITRLLFIAVSSVHIFACLFYKVKEISAASQDDVVSFYTSRNIDENVLIHFSVHWIYSSPLADSSGLIAGPGESICKLFLIQNLQLLRMANVEPHDWYCSLCASITC